MGRDRSGDISLRGLAEIDSQAAPLNHGHRRWVSLSAQSTLRAQLCNRIQDKVAQGMQHVRAHTVQEMSLLSLEPDETLSESTRCVIIVDKELPTGRAANAAAVIALTLGKRHPHLAGPDLVDASGCAHPGLIPIGIAVLSAAAPDLGKVRDKALKGGIDVVDFPRQGQLTNDYAEFGASVRKTSTAEIDYVGIGLYGPRKAVGRIVGGFSLLK
jgi:hypothetical protein